MIMMLLIVLMRECDENDDNGLMACGLIITVMISVNVICYHSVSSIKCNSSNNSSSTNDDTKY